MTTTLDDFDLDRYLRASGRVDLARVAWRRIADHPVSGVEARCLAYMMDIESHTVVFLRDLLATRALLEPDVTAFLSCWAYEELWHGEAFSRFLGEAGFRLGPEREVVRGHSPYPTRVDRNATLRRLVGRGGTVSHLATMAASALIPEFVAVHMTWGAINELSTLTGYHALLARTRNPVLTDLLRAIVKDERRHFAFYHAQARARLAGSRRARRVTRWALEHLWAPVGTGVRPQQETDFVVAALFGDADGERRLVDLDRTIAGLPGLSGLTLVSDARRDALDRLPPRQVAVMASEDGLARAGIHRSAATGAAPQVRSRASA